mmetsp:Transcript_21281/g.53607  ORF Transcript_21281/g.53607 Transcript_21281/m.53607 type:complete len:211 (-) Transcript_21281:229-861(-)
MCPWGPLGPTIPSLPTLPLPPPIPSCPLGPLGPCGPGGPMGPETPVLPALPRTPFSPGSPLSPFAPSYPSGPLRPRGPTCASLASMSFSSSTSCFLMSSLTLKSDSCITCLSDFIESTSSSILTSLACSMPLRRFMRYSCFLSSSFCFLTPSLSSTGHIGHPAGATPTSPKRIIVGGGAGGGGRVLKLTWPMALPSGSVTATSPIGGTLT